MNIDQYSIIKTTTFARIHLTESEVDFRNAEDLRDAAINAEFPNVAAAEGDDVAVDIKPDGSAVILVCMVRDNTTDTSSSSS